MRAPAFAALAAISLAASSGAFAQTTSLVYESQPGDYIGQGVTSTLTPANGTFTASRSGGRVEVSFQSGGSVWWRLTLAAPGGAPLAPGVYAGATRWPFQSPTKPGLDFSGSGRGCNTLTGRFVVYEAVYSGVDGVQNFAADFEQHCEGGAPALFGSVRINSSFPRNLLLSVSNAAAYEGDTETEYAIFTVALSRASASPVTVSYSTVDASARAGVEYLASAGTLAFPAGVTARSVVVPLIPDLAREADKTFLVNLTGPEGATLAIGQGTGAILDDDGPLTRVYFDSQIGDPMGGGKATLFTSLDGPVASSRSDNVVHVGVPTDGGWNLYFAAPQSLPLTPGTYEGARAYSFQAAAEPGLWASRAGRFCNALTGRFVVLEAVFGANNEVERFAVDFEQHCEGQLPALFGSVRINSLMPLPHVNSSPASGRLSAGWYHTCTVTEAGGVKCWGNNLDGQLGDGSLTRRASPVDVLGLSSGVLSVSGGGFHTCALTRAGGVKCWGYNGYGALGDGTTTSRAMPVEVLGLTTGVARISAGLYHTCAVTVVGEVKCWGNNANGQLGDGTTTQSNQPVEVLGLTREATAVSAGAYHTCAVVNPNARCWGHNAYGQLGDGTTADKSLPVIVSVISDFQAISAGLYQTCAAAYFSNAYCWGNNLNGQLGNGSATSAASPVSVLGLSLVVKGAATGSFHSCAVTNLGGAACWGSNFNGKLGDGTTTQRLTPVAVSGLTSGVLAISTGAQHTCALTSTGEVKCWGLNADGQLGDGTTVSRSTPTSVPAGNNDGTASLGAPTVTSPGSGQPLIATGVGFSWTAVGGAGGYDLRVYDLKSLGAVYSGSVSGGGSTSSLVTLGAGSYQFAVRACAGGYVASQCGKFGTVAFTVSPAAPSGAPPSVTFPAQGASLTASTQTLSWTAVTPNPALSGLTYEVLLRDLTAGTTALQVSVPSPNLSTIFTMRSSTQYELKVRACQAGCGPFSTPVTFALTLPAVPTTPPSISSCTVNGGNSLTCIWNAVANADAYQVQVVQPPPAGPGAGALTVAARQVSATTVTLAVPAGAATVFVAACNGDGCGPNATTGITAAGPNSSLSNLGTPIAGTVVPGPGVLFTWNRVPGDNGSNTQYRLFVQDLSRQATALDVFTTNNFYSAFFKAEGARYDALVVSNPGLVNQATGPSLGFNVAGASATAPTMVSPAHNSTLAQGNLQLGWSPVPGATLYEYFVAVLGQGTASARGVTPGLLAQVPLTGAGSGTIYSGIVRACPAGATCASGSDAGWGPWSNAAGGPGVTNFTVTP